MDSYPPEADGGSIPLLATFFLLIDSFSDKLINQCTIGFELQKTDKAEGGFDFAIR